MSKFEVLYLGKDCVEIEIKSTRKVAIIEIAKEIFTNSFVSVKEFKNKNKLNLIIDLGYGNKIDEISLSKLYKRIFSLL